MKLAMDVDSSTSGILSEIDNILMYVEKVDDIHAGTGMPDSVLENVEWDHPPNFPRRPADDPLVKELLTHVIAKDQDPYISRIARF